MENFSENLVLFYEKLSSWEIEIVRDSGITLPQMHVIEVLGINGPMRMKDLADKLGVVMGTLTVMIKRLLQMELVLRNKNLQDQRSFQISLTKKGINHFNIHHNHHLILAEEICQDLTINEQETFNKIISKIVNHF